VTEGAARGVHPPAPVAAGTVGVFGGTFDPIHVGHLAVAEEAAEALGLEQVLFVPAGVPPHKPHGPVATGEDRLAMVELAIEGNPRFAASRIELDRPGPSYTADTLATLGGDRRRLSLILSVEAYRALPTWHEPRRVVEAARLVVVPRDGFAEADPTALAAWFPDLPDVSADAVFLDGPWLRLSASAIRARLAAGRSIRYLVPDAVRAHIDDHGCYRT